MRARASVSVCPRVSVHPCLRVLVRPCQCTFARVSVHAPEYFVCARAGEDEGERGSREAGLCLVGGGRPSERRHVEWETSRVNFLIQLPFEHASLDSLSGMEVGHWP